MDPAANLMESRQQTKMPYIPIVDCSVFSNLEEATCDTQQQLLENTAQEIVTALQEIGFVYLRNHGIADTEISKVFEVSREFFALDLEIKKKYTRETCGNQEHGYVEIGIEKLDPHWKYEEIRESFNITANEGLPFPTDVCHFRDIIQQFFTTSAGLATRLLSMIGMGLRLEDPSFLVKCHNEMTGINNNTTLRLLHYPPMVKKENVIRCGEHSDYGSITILFQDSVGGLQVKHRDGSYVDATPVDGCVLVNVGDLLERWTADRLVSTKHRVLVPNSESLQKRDRYSLALFVHPDKNVVVECLDKSKKYPSVSSDEYLNQRLQATYSIQ